MKREENSGAIVHIIGHNHFSNKVLINLIENELGYSCKDNKGLQEIKKVTGPKAGHFRELILWDCQSVLVNALWTAMGNGDSLSDSYYIAVFNVPEESDIGMNTLRFGGHGIFYQKDSPDIFIKGIKAILDGELWVSREVANKYISKTRKRRNQYKDDLLTNREKEILICLTTGHTNEEIADALNISPHTVRTHLSNIYGKLNINSRFQAALWAAENLL